MNQERWQQITELFEAALLRGADSRAAFIAESSAGDDELRREVESMLESHAQASQFIEEPALAVAARQSGDGASLAGQTIAQYQVLSLLGAGGMGDVYLAFDTKLGRKVALKLLPDYVAGDGRRARLFTREARAASALNHPNIITVYEIGQLEDRYYIAMEYIDGDTLGAHIHRLKTPLSKLLKYLQQVAEGLTKAHAAGIVHRDLKPDNIMVTRDGYAKVLDFGVAKLVEQNVGTESRGHSEDATALMTPQSMPGMVMGTLGYMSPEQAQGRVLDIDHRSDIFSFGCILYEAATGRKAFEGADVLDSLHKTVHAPVPQVTDALPAAPDSLQRIVRRCVAKDPEKRYQSIKDVAIELEELQQELQGQPELLRVSAAVLPGAVTRAAVQTVAAVHSTHDLTAQKTSSAEYLTGEIKRNKAGVVFIAVALVLAVSAIGFMFFLARQGYLGRRQDASRPISFERMKLARLTTTGKARDATISPDGKYVAYLSLESRGGVARDGGTASIWIRQVATSRDIMIVEPRQFILRGLTFSPDSNYVYYITQSLAEGVWLNRISVLGGDAQRVMKNVFSAIRFSPDGKRIAYVRNHLPVVGDSQVIMADADGANERIASTHKAGELFATPTRPTAPAWSPDGKVLACALGTHTGRVTLLEIQVDGGAEREIGAEGWSYIDNLAWLPDQSGLLLTGRDHSSPQPQIWHVAYPSGDARRVTNDLNEYQSMSLSADARAMVVVQSAQQTALWVMPDGKSTEARAVTTGTGKGDGFWGISWTPDGNLVYGSNASGNRDIWLLDMARGTQKQLTKDARQNFYPQVTPDGRSVLFLSDRGDKFAIWRTDIDGGNTKQLLAANLLRFSSSPDGQWIIYWGLGSRGIPALWRARIDGGEPVQLSDEYWQELASVSPDGKQIAFQYFKLGTGGFSIGLMPIEGGQITKIAEAPYRLSPILRWTPDGTALAYIDNRGGAGQIWAQPISGGPAKKLTDFKSDSLFWFDWSRDGKQLALARGTQISDVVLISNFR